MPASKTSGIDAEIRSEIYTTLQRLGAKSDLLTIVGSWGDTMDDAWVLQALRGWNARAEPFTGRRPPD